MTITANHREVWKEFARNPELKRALELAADVTRQPVTDAEEMFINLVIAQINSAYYAMSDQLIVDYDGLRRDVADFFSRPIPKSVSGRTRQFQNKNFIDFVEGALKD